MDGGELAQTPEKEPAEGHPEERVLEAKPRASKRREWSLLSNGKLSHIRPECVAPETQFW